MERKAVGIVLEPCPCPPASQLPAVRDLCFLEPLQECSQKVVLGRRSSSTNTRVLLSPSYMSSYRKGTLDFDITCLRDKSSVWELCPSLVR